MNKTLLLISANRHCDPYPVYPLGIGYLRGYLEKKLPGLRVEAADGNLLSNREICERIRLLRPDYIGCSLRNADGANSLDQRSFIDEYAALVRQIRLVSEAPVLIGGPAFSIYPRAVFDAVRPDYGIVGEGEESLRQLILALDEGRDPAGTEGIACYRQGKFTCTPHRNYIRSFELAYEESLIDYYWFNSGMLNIQTKRGCPYRCIYCSYPLIDGRQVRTFDPEEIVERIGRLQREHGVNYVFFTDSVFNIRNDYNIRLAETIIRNNLKINWAAYFSPGNLTDGMLALFKASGLTHIEFGTESLCDRQLANYGKDFTVDQAAAASELCLKHNIYYAHFLILGGWGETPESVLETIENSRRFRYTVFFPFFGMRIYPGTRLQELAVGEGKISPDDPLLEPTYYLAEGLDLETIRRAALQTGKAWIFPDDPDAETMDRFRKKRNKKGLLWEYLRKP